jgi:hypothetical protein
MLPLGYRLGIDAVAFSQRLHALLTMLYRSTDCRSCRGAPMKNLAYDASFHSMVKIIPSNAGTEHLGPRGFLFDRLQVSTQPCRAKGLRNWRPQRKARSTTVNPASSQSWFQLLRTLRLRPHSRTDFGDFLPSVFSFERDGSVTRRIWCFHIQNSSRPFPEPHENEFCGHSADKHFSGSAKVTITI